MHQRPHEKLVVWREAHALTLLLYRLTGTFPQEERFGLVSQMRRSSASVPTNIAEGNAKKSNKERHQFFERSLASLEELHYQCRLSRDLGYLSQEYFERLDDHMQRVSYLLTRLKVSIS
ncbi:MAG: four helix bundle protein [Candidatus Peribacteraceae bacterium]|nr:four helix bundle protein [Candidatus Peribacteraceae bacterium]